MKKNSNKKEIEPLQMPFDMYGNKAWVDEFSERKFIRENLHHLVQTMNSLKGENDGEARFHRVKRDDDLAEFCVECPNGTDITVVYDPNRKFPKPPREDEGDKSHLKTFVKRFTDKDGAKQIAKMPKEK